MNLRPSGYEPDELPSCSTPRYLFSVGDLFALNSYILYHCLLFLSTLFLKKILIKFKSVAIAQINSNITIKTILKLSSNINFPPL